MKALSIGTHSAILVVLAFCCISASALPTDELMVSVYATDGITVLNTTTLSIERMKGDLPVQGDGITHYYHQGPVFVESKEGQWDRNETANFKDMGAVKGAAVRDLVGLVGGMEPGDEVMIKASDGYHVEFGYPNIYRPDPRQGNITVTWFNGEESAVGERQGMGYPPSYHVGMRLVFLADTSTNTEGKHVFGNWDMHEVMPAEKIHLFENLYPSTSGYTVKWVDEVRVYRGGYRGSHDALPKSYEAKMEEVYPPPPTEAPILGVSTLVACCCLVIFRRGKP